MTTHYQDEDQYKEQLDSRKGLAFDKVVAKAYCQKLKDANSRGLEFNLSFATFKNLYRAKRCQLTGVGLTLENRTEKPQPNSLTVDRINSKLGYIEGNVMAVSFAANGFKAVLECGGALCYDDAIKVGKKLSKLKKIGKI